jgi:hypothetical protein
MQVTHLDYIQNDILKEKIQFNFMQQGPCEANSHSAGKIFCLLWNLKVHYHVH